MLFRSGFKDVGVVDGDVRGVAEAEGEFAGEGGVELDAMKAGATWREKFGDGAMAGADFGDGALGDVTERVGDAQAGGFVDEKVLTEFGFARQGSKESSKVVRSKL